MRNVKKNNSFWYLLKTKARQEKRAKDHLERQNIEVFCPEVHVQILRSGESSFESEVLFPGYLFIKLASWSKSVNSIRSTRGVLNFVSFGDSVARAPNDLIAALKDRIAGASENLISRLPKTGDRLIVVNGSLRGVDVIFAQPDGKTRAFVLMKIMNREVRASMKYSDLSRD